MTRTKVEQGRKDDDSLAIAQQGDKSAKVRGGGQFPNSLFHPRGEKKTFSPMSSNSSSCGKGESRKGKKVFVWGPHQRGRPPPSLPFLFCKRLLGRGGKGERRRSAHISPIKEKYSEWKKGKRKVFPPPFFTSDIAIYQSFGLWPPPSLLRRRRGRTKGEREGEEGYLSGLSFFFGGRETSSSPP